MVDITQFSNKQKKILMWWKHPKYSKYNGIIADGAIRSGKTLSMILGYLLWSMETYDDEKFAICGYTVGSVNKNIVKDFLEFCDMIGFVVKHNRTDNYMIVSSQNHTNTYYIYGGDNSRSQDSVQGMTFAGVLFDEVAIQEESFVNQATGRCSVEGSKYWFNCNPNIPTHYFKTDWIDQKEKKKLYYLHFTMEDNPSLSEAIKEKYRIQYTGSFHDRYIKGLWSAGEGAIYDMFDRHHIIDDEDIPRAGRHYIAIDYGTKNATVFLHIIDTPKCCYVVDEYYYSGRGSNGVSKQKTNSEYVQDLVKFKNAYCKNYECVIVDPSAASFKAEMDGHMVYTDADNEVLEGIRLTASYFSTDKLKIHKRCENTINELYSYRWKDNKNGKEEPEKENDHCCDALRYFIKTMKRR